MRMMKAVKAPPSRVCLSGSCQQRAVINSCWLWGTSSRYREVKRVEKWELWKLLSLRRVPLLHVTNSSARWEGCDNEEISNTHTHTHAGLKLPAVLWYLSQTHRQSVCVCVCVCVRTRGGEFFRVISISALREERKVNNSNQESSNRWIHAEKSRLVIPFALSFVECKKGVFTEVADPKKLCHYLFTLRSFQTPKTFLSKGENMVCFL